nr:MAG TPA: hypothetical protein [Caudoviricetes sp.]
MKTGAGVTGRRIVQVTRTSQTFSYVRVFRTLQKIERSTTLDVGLN